MAKDSTQKPSPKTMVIFDLDNTLTDTLKFWGRATSLCLNALSKLRGIKKRKLNNLVRKAPPQYRFCDMDSLIRWLNRQDGMPRAKTPAERRKDRMHDHLIRDSWFSLQKKHTVFYEGVVDVLLHLKEQGTNVVIETDTEQSSCIRRFWFLAYNHVKNDPRFDDPLQILDLIDHLYSQASIEDDSEILKDIDPVFVQAMKMRMTVWKDGQRKPAPHHTGKILNDFDTQAQNAIFVGDTHKDGGSARGVGMQFVWTPYGTQTDEVTVKLHEDICEPGFVAGKDAIVALFNEKNKPHIELHKALTELHHHFVFTEGQRRRTIMPKPLEKYVPAIKAKPLAQKKKSAPAQDRKPGHP